MKDKDKKNSLPTETDLIKGLPPRIASRLKYWFHRQGRRVHIWGGKNVGQLIAHKMEEAMALKELRKNQFMARVHSDGIVKLDFGAEVPQSIKKAAIDWAKRKGLKPIEANLSKSNSSISSVVYTKSTDSNETSQELLAQYIWEIS